MQQLRQTLKLILFLLFVSFMPIPAYSAEAEQASQPLSLDEEVSIDRIQLVKKQISMLKERSTLAKREYADLQKQHDQQLSQLPVGKVSKGLLDKASLDISVVKSNLDSLTMELADTQQMVSWLEKNIQEIKNQLNVLSVFGLKTMGDSSSVAELKSDLRSQKELLQLEKTRVKTLDNLRSLTYNILQLKKEKHRQITTQLKMYRLLNIKQQQVHDELAYQLEQNAWLQQLNSLNEKLTTIDPTKSRAEYLATERAIFYVNENANHAYSQSLLARYKEQIQQMKLAVYKNNSISVLNEISDQVTILNKQLARLDTSLKMRAAIMEKHISYLTPRKKADLAIEGYINQLATLKQDYNVARVALTETSKSLAEFRVTLEKALQEELSSRQGLPTFGLKMLLDLGKECLFVPALTYHMLKNLTGNLKEAVRGFHLFDWCLLSLLQAFFIFVSAGAQRLVKYVLKMPSEWRNKINTKWLSLQWVQHNFIEFMLLINLIVIMSYFAIPFQSYAFIVYVSFVWVIFKSIMTFLRVCLVEATHDTTGHDVRLYRRLKWIVIAGGMVTALTVFIHQLPLIYELKTLFDRIFLFFLMAASFLFLRSWRIVPNFILSYMGSQHPYIEKCVRLISFLIPLLLFTNSVIGLFGFVNLVMTISGYEGIFMVVLVAYLVVRGLLSDALELLSRLMIQYVYNGWLWTEAFLKPLDRVLKVTLFLLSWAVLFLLYGWDKQSPIVERFTRLLNYKLANVLNTTITPLGIIELFVLVSIFYWSARWTREFVYRLLLSKTKDMGIRNSIAILSQYCVVVTGVFVCLRVLGIDYRALTFVVTAFAFGVGLGLRDLANNFACGFLILLERPLRVGDIVNINGTEGEVMNIGSRAVTIRTWDHMELVVPNTEIFNKSFTNWTAKDNVVRCVVDIKISRHDDPHVVKDLIYKILSMHKDVLTEPVPEVFMKQMDDIVMEFEVRYFVNIRHVKSRISVISSVLMTIWDVFNQHGIKPPYPKQEIFIRNGDVAATMTLLEGPHTLASK